MAASPQRPRAPLEPELGPPPREAGPDREGLREILAAAAFAAAGLTATAVFLSADDRPSWLTAVFVIFALLGVYLAVRFIGVWRNRLYLVREGVVASGVVIEKNPEPKGRSYYVVWYTANDEQWSVEGSGMHTVADVGDAVTVLCDPADPGRSVIYRLMRCKVREPLAAGPASPAPEN